MAGKRPFLFPLAGTSDGSGDLTLKSPRLKAGELLCVQLISVRNNDTGSCLATFGFERASLQVWLETVVMTTATYVYNYSKPVWVPSDYRVLVKFSAAGDSKLCEAWLYGYLARNGGEQPA